MNKKFLRTFTWVLLVITAALTQTEAKTLKQVTFPAPDGLKITADLYFDGNPNKPFLILYHQASYSRGEYRETAPWLQSLGFNCMAVDQRSGFKAANVMNETARRAVAAGKKTLFVHAEQDMTAAVTYVTGKLGAKKVILVGSSYSAALVFKIAAENSSIAGLVAFSPGEYFGKKNYIAGFARNIRIPVWMTAATSELGKVQDIFAAVGTTKKTLYKPKGPGIHGSRALWKTTPGFEGARSSLKDWLSGFHQG